MFFLFRGCIEIIMFLKQVFLGIVGGGMLDKFVTCLLRVLSLLDMTLLKAFLLVIFFSRVLILLRIWLVQSSFYYCKI